MGLSLPVKTGAISEANRPRVLPSASMTRHAGLRSEALVSYGFELIANFFTNLWREVGVLYLE